MQMHSYADSWTLDWLWILYLGFTFLLFSTIGSWGYTYRVHRRFDGLQPKGARDILDSAMLVVEFPESNTAN